MTLVSTVQCSEGIDEILYVSPSADGGWGPVTHLAQMAARVFGAQLTTFHPETEFSRLQRYSALLPRWSSGSARLSIVSNPGDLVALRSLRVLEPRRRVEAVWIIDSFWSDRIPRFARMRGMFDYVFITDAELVDEYAAALVAPVEWLPWGADCLTAPAETGDREIDVLRVGRQPEAWDDDAVSAEVFDRNGLRFSGRPPFGGDADSSRRMLLERLAAAKMTMAWSNAVSPADYTHPTREYISGRWTDAAACGTQVLGIPPRCAATEVLGAETLIVPASTAPEDVVEAAAAAAEEWTPELSSRIRAHARAHLDWRRRLAVIADRVSADAPRLDAELASLAG